MQELPKNDAPSPIAETGEDKVKSQLKILSEGLYFTSETDAEIQPFYGRQAKAVTKEEILRQSGAAANVSVSDDGNFTEFFARLTEMQDWFGDEEKTKAQRFAELKSLLERNFRDLKVFKIGKIQLDIYVVGLDAENNLLGIKTKAVET